MSSISWDFEAGSDGDALTTTNASADALNISAGTATISAAQYYSGTRSAHLIATASNGLLAFTKNITSTAVQVDFYVYWVTLPSAEVTLVRMLDASANTCWNLNFTSLGRLRIYDGAGTSQWVATSAQQLAVGKWYHVTAFATQDAAAGTIRATAIDTTNATTTADSTLLTNKNTGANPYSSFRLGLKSGTSTATGELYLDLYSYNQSAAAKANAGLDQTVEPLSSVALTAAGSAGNGTLTYSWSLQANTSARTPTLSNPSSATPSYTSPADWYSGSSQNWQVSVNDGTSTATDTVLITVLPATVGLVTGTSTVVALNVVVAP